MKHLLAALFMLLASPLWAQQGGGFAPLNNNGSNVVLPAAINNLGLNVGGALKVTAGGVTSQAAAADLSNGVTGSGAVALQVSPSFQTPSLGNATAVSLNNMVFTQPSPASTWTIAGGKTFTINNTLTLSGTDGSTLAIGAGGTLAASATTDTTNASNITSGTLAAARLPAKAAVHQAINNPAGTTSTTGVMMGLAGSVTPTRSGTVLIIITGDMFNATAIADGATAQLYIGTGTAPANGAAPTGTATLPVVTYIAATTAEKAPFSLVYLAPAQPLGTATWIDINLKAVTGGTATIENVGITAVEQ